MIASRRRFFGKFLGAGVALGASGAVTTTAAPTNTDDVRQYGDYTLTWEGWRQWPDAWRLFGFWRGVRRDRAADESAFLYSTTGGLVSYAWPGASLNMMTRDGWQRLAPDAGIADREIARQRALEALMASIDSGEFTEQLARGY